MRPPLCTKWLPTLLLALALGALTATTVAWSIAWTKPQALSSMGYGKGRATEATPDPWPLKWSVNVAARSGMVRKDFGVDTGEQLLADEVQHFDDFASDSVSRAAIRRHAFLLNGKDRTIVRFDVISYGWPVPCLASERAFTALDASSYRMITYNPSISRGFRLDPEYSAASETDLALSPDPRNTLNETYSTLHIRGHRLPLGALPGPFALCTIVYSALWLSAFFILGAVRRKLRPRAGHCPTCRYNLAGLPPHTPCPECGSHLHLPPPASIG